MSAEDRKYTVGAVTFNNMFQVGMGAPLDNRDVVRRYAHLVSGIGANHYMGQVVYVTGEYDSQLDDDDPAPQTIDGIVVEERGFYYFKNETEGWIKQLTIEDGGSGGGDDSKIPTDVLPVDEPNGIAPLDENGLVPSGNLPSFVDEVVEGYARREGTDHHIVFYKKRVVEGYYYNGAFYSDDQHTTAITPSDEKYYYDLTGSAWYYYDSDNSEYVEFYENEVIDGYYYNGSFYSDAEHTTAITPVANKYYNDLPTSLVYVYDTENTEYKLVEDEDAPFIVGGKGKIYVDLLTDKTYRWSGSVYAEISNTQVSKTFTTNISVGGIPTGTSIDTTMSLEDVLKKILVNVYQPFVATNASASIEKATGSSAAVISIGAKSLTYNMKITGNKGVVKRNNGTSDVTLGDYAGAISKFKLYHSANNVDTSIKEVTSSASNETVAMTVSSGGNFQIDGTDVTIGGATLSTSTEQVISFKGGVTFGNGTQYKDSAGDDATLAAFVGQEKKSSATTVEVVCPVYANTNSSHLDTTYAQSIKSKSVLSSTTDFSQKTPDQSSNIGINISFPSHSSSLPFTFEIPTAWSLKKVWWWDTGFNVWRDHTSDWEIKSYSSVNYHTISVNDVNVSYTTYYYASPDPIPGGRIYKILINQ